MTTSIQLRTEGIDLLNVEFEFFLSQDEQIVKLKSDIEKALEETSEIVICTAHDIEVAARYVSVFKKLAKRIEEERKQFTSILDDKKKEIMNAFGKIPALFESEQKRLEKEILDFQRKEREEAYRKAEEERRRKEEEAIRAAIAEEERRKKEAAERNIPASEIPRVEVPVIAEVIPVETKISSMNTAGLKTRKTKSFEIIDMNLIPREYLIPDEAKIRAERNKYDAVNQDGSEVKTTIPGVRFTYKEGLA